MLPSLGSEEESLACVGTQWRGISVDRNRIQNIPRRFDGQNTWRTREKKSITSNTVRPAVLRPASAIRLPGRTQNRRAERSITEHLRVIRQDVWATWTDQTGFSQEKAQTYLIPFHHFTRHTGPGHSQCMQIIVTEFVHALRRVKVNQ